MLYVFDRVWASFSVPVSGYQYADQFADRQTYSTSGAAFAFGIFRMGPVIAGVDRAPGRRDDRLVGLAHGGCAFGLHAADRGAADRLCDQQDRPSGRTGTTSWQPPPTPCVRVRAGAANRWIPSTR